MVLSCSLSLLAFACGTAAEGGDAGTDGAAVDGSPVLDSGGRDALPGDAGPDAVVDRDSASPRDGATEADSGPPSGDGLPEIPAAAGPCPDIVNGAWTTLPTATGTHRVWFNFMEGAGADGDRPLAISWTPGRDSAPGMVRGDFQPSGGVVARPERLGDWWGNEYLEVADAIVACSTETLGVSPRRIHTVGLSRGGSMVRILASHRTRYLASVAVFSSGTQGGVGAPLERDDNPFALLAAYGSDAADQPFRDLTIAYRDELAAAGHPVIECTHEMGHRYPWEMGPATARFFLDHPFGTRPTPYVAALPAALPAYCHTF